MDSGEVQDIQGVSREGPFTIIWDDGTREEVTLAVLGAVARILGPLSLPGGEPTVAADQNMEQFDPNKPSWWDDALDGDFDQWQWDVQKYGAFPAKWDKDGGIVGPDKAEAMAEKKRTDALGKGATTAYQQSQLEHQRQVEARLQQGQEFNQAQTLAKANKRTIDDIEDELWQKSLAGDADARSLLYLLDSLRDDLERPRGLTPQQAMGFIMDLAISPDEMGVWIDALTADWQQGQFAQTGQTPQAPPNPLSPQFTATQGQQDGFQATPPGGQPGKVGGQAQIEAITAEMQVLGRTPETPERNAKLKALGEEIRVLQRSQEVERTGAAPGGVQAPPQGLTASQLWVRSRQGQVMVDPNPETTTPGRFYDPIGHMWEPMEAYNERMAKFKAGQAAAQQPAPALGSSNIPPWQLYGAGYKQEGPMPPDQQAQYDAFRVQQPQAPPVVTPPVGQGTPTQPGFQTTAQGGARLTPPQVNLPRFQGNEAVFEQQLFSNKQPDLRTALLQVKHRQITRKRQRQFEAGRPAVVSFR